jgi:hypothetical protein
VRWAFRGLAALCAGFAAGALDYVLLSRGCGRLTGGGKRGALWILAGFGAPVAGLGLCAALSPAALPWFGCACGGVLTLLAVIHFIRKK